MINLKKIKKATLRLLVSLTILYIILLIPDFGVSPIIKQANKKAFLWSKDAVWKQMEEKFKAAKLATVKTSDSLIQFQKTILENKLLLIQNKNISALDSNLFAIENIFFDLSALIAANPKEVKWYVDYYNKFRRLIKLQSQQWNLQNANQKDALYTLLYGLRAAVEEVLLQTNNELISPAMLVQDEKSTTPYTTIFGIQVHSGDMLVSRGGAEVSALISRGNDYPGNFSHVALIYIDDKSNKPYLVEAHIEKGVAISTVDEYIKDKKLRFMVLRLRRDLPQLKIDSMLPQKAAQAMYQEALSQHIPYDFKMNFYDSTALFCSEVASSGYKKNGVQLWQNPSTISSQGVVNWLSNFGVQNFITQMPSDLEYDPQLTIVAEWRNAETLYKDHIDNATMDALLQKANEGSQIGYNKWMLPFVRCIKGYCWIKNKFGKVGMIPEGMSATQALKNETFVKLFTQVKNKTAELANIFEKQNGYRPPYWQLVKFAEESSK